MIFFTSPRKRWQAWFVATTVIVFGSALIVGGIASIFVGWSWNTMAIPVGVFLCTGGLIMYSWHLASPKPLVVQQQPGRTSIAIWRTYLYGALASNTTMSLIPIWGLVTAIVLSSVWWPWLLAVAVTVPMVSRVLQSIRDQPAIVLSPEGISYHGPGIDRYLAWNDMLALEVDEGRFGRIIRVIGKPISPSYRHSKRYRVPPFESGVPERTMEISAHGPREEDLITVALPILRDYLAHPTARTEIGTRSAVDRWATVADSMDTPR